MLRTKLVAVFGVLLALILGTNAVLLWATSRTTFDYERSQVAHAQLEAHLHLALDIYRHVKQLSDLLIAAQDGPNGTVILADALWQASASEPMVFVGQQPHFDLNSFMDAMLLHADEGGNA